MTYNGRTLEFLTDDRLFSPRHPDEGTLFMLSQTVFRSDDCVLDLGCGWGFVGAVAATYVPANRVFMTDADPLAVQISSENLRRNQIEGVTCIQSDAFSSVEVSDFSLILSNPPYHTDFRVAKEFIEKGFNRLRIGGRMMMVTKRKEWYKQKFISVFGGVRIAEENGYYVFIGEKRRKTYANRNKDGAAS